jgi:exopolysaccharide biosynthesis polyprenyl glycosylphosphotransferase
MSDGSTGVRRARETRYDPEPPTAGLGPAAAPPGDLRVAPPEKPEGHTWPRAGTAFRFRGRWVQFTYALTDIFFVTFNATCIFSIRFFSEIPTGFVTPVLQNLRREFLLGEYFAFLVLYAALILLCCQSQNLYRTPRTRSRLDESLAVVKAVGGATLLLMAFLYLSGFKSVSRLVVLFSGMQNVATLVGWRLWKRQIVDHRVANGIGTTNVLIVGAGRTGQELAKYLERHKQLGYIVKGFLDPQPNGDPRVLGTIEDLPQVALAHFADEVFIAPPSERELVERVAMQARSQRLNVKVVPELYDGLGWNAPVVYVGEIPVLELHREPIPALGLFFKRAIDIVGSALALVFFSPLLAFLAIAIKLGSPGPVFYRSERVGKKGRKFVCYKFRSMVEDADALKEELRQQNERNGPFFKMEDDPRVTRLGKILRKYSLDEFPQFWNVLQGEMSLVGPRPHPLDDVEKYDLEHLRRLDVKPGLTGLWQVTARQDPSFETNMALDLEYIENWNLWLDVKILCRTVPAVVRGDGR